MSIVTPHAPYFAGQPKDIYTLWGCGLFVDNKGGYIDKTMAQATDQETPTGPLRHLYYGDILDEVCRTTIMIPVVMLYITSEFERREPSDWSPVIPHGTKNFVLLGQYVEVPQDVAFIVEYSVRGAIHVVYGLPGLKNEIPVTYHGIADPSAAFAGLKTLLSWIIGRPTVDLYQPEAGHPRLGRLCVTVPLFGQKSCSSTSGIYAAGQLKCYWCGCWV